MMTIPLPSKLMPWTWLDTNRLRGLLRPALVDTSAPIHDIALLRRSLSPALGTEAKDQLSTHARNVFLARFDLSSPSSTSGLYGNGSARRSGRSAHGALHLLEHCSVVRLVYAACLSHLSFMPFLTGQCPSSAFLCSTLREACPSSLHYPLLFVFLRLASIKRATATGTRSHNPPPFHPRSWIPESVGHAVSRQERRPCVLVRLRCTAVFFSCTACGWPPHSSRMAYYTLPRSPSVKGYVCGSKIRQMSTPLQALPGDHCVLGWID